MQGSVRAALVLVGAAVLVAAASGMPRLWDGAWFALRAFDEGTPTLLYGRPAGAVLQAPSIAVRSMTGDVVAAGVAFDLAYAAVPLLVLLGSWLVVRHERPGLIVWPFLAIGIVGLSGQAFWVSEATLAVQLGWPAVLAAAIGTVRRHAIVVGASTVLLAFSHPSAIPLLGVAGLAAGLRAAGSGARTAGRAAAPWLTLAAIVALRYAVLRSPYEQEAITPAWITEMFRGGVAGAPIVAVAAGWGIAGALLVARRRTDALAVGLAVVAGAVLVPWAADPGAWDRALQFRAWAIFLVGPVYLLAVVDALRRGAAGVRDRQWAVVAAAAVFAVVVSVQAGSWRGLVARLSAELGRPGPACVAAESLGWTRGTALAHWSLPSRSLLVQGRDPVRIILPGATCAAGPPLDRVPIKATAFDRDDRVVGGWFRWERLLDGWRADATRLAAPDVGPGD